MSKRKKKELDTSEDKTPQEELKELAEQFRCCPLPADLLEDELYDACILDTELQHEQICKEPLVNRLTFLWSRGWRIERLKELVEQGMKNAWQ